MTRSALLLVLLAAPLPAAADPPTFRLAWVRGDGAASCPDGRAVRRDLAALIGREAIRDEAPASLEAVVSHPAEAAPWVARVFLRGADGALVGERTLTADGSCARLTEAVLVVLAVAAEVAPPAADAPPPAPPPPPPPAVTAPAVTARRPAARRWRFGARALGGVALGVVSGASAVAGLRVEVRPPAWPRLYASGVWVVGAVGEVPPGTVSTAVAGGSLGLCPLAARAGAVDLAVCAGLFAGTLLAAGSGFSVNRSETLAYVALEGGAHARWDVTRHVDLAAGVDVLVPLVRDTLVVDGVGAAFEPPAAGVRATIGVGLHFE